MKIWVSSLERVHQTALKAKPRSAVSLLSPGDVFPTIEGLEDDEHHRLHLHDIREEIDGQVAPSDLHIESLVTFLKGWRPDDSLLIHCWAGISRSTATAYIAACLHNPEADESVIAEEIGRASPTAYPNTRIVRLADDMLNRGGRMADAAGAICADQSRAALVARTDAAEPFFIPARFPSPSAKRRTG